MAQIPTVGDVRAWAGIPQAELSDEQLELILAAEIDLQAAACPFWEPETPFGDDVPGPLAQALLRRCARAIAAKGLPLGSLPVAATGVPATFGFTTLPRLDAEIERMESPFRVTGIG